MNFQNLQYFICIAETGSISEAARRNYITQQSMSTQLRKVEEYFGKTLFIRSSPLRLTEAGRAVYETARSVMAQLDALQERLETDDARDPTLVIGLMMNDTPPFFGDLLEYFNHLEKDPVRILLQREPVNGQGEPDDPDLYLGIESPGSGYSSVPLLKDRFAVVSSRILCEHVLGEGMEELIRAARAGRLESAQFSRLPFAELDGLDGGDTRSRIPRAGTYLKSGDMGFLNNMCRRGQYAVLLPEDFARRTFENEPDILIFPLADDAASIIFSIYYREGKPMKEQAGRFIRAAVKCLQTAAEREDIAEDRDTMTEQRRENTL